jgi:hypothetical protein
VCQYAAPWRAALKQIYPSLNIPADPKGQSKHEKYVFSFLDTLRVTGILCGQYLCIWLRYRFAYTHLSINFPTEIHTKMSIQVQSLSEWLLHSEYFKLHKHPGRSWSFNLYKVVM